MVQLRPLGATGLSIAPLVLGGNVFGVNGMDRDRSFAVLDGFVGGGGTMLDTADYYSAYLPDGKGGESETMIGEWLASRGGRDRIQIATKVGGPMGSGFGGLGKDYLPRAVDASLKRLQTDYIDLYFAHFDDDSVPQEEVVEAFDALVTAGKVRSLGASNFTPARFASALDIAAAAGLTPYTAFQPHYNLLERDLETELLPLCRERDIGVVAFFSLAQGYLTGKYRSEGDLSQSRRGGGVKKYMEGKGPGVLAVMDEIAQRRGISHAAIALAWVAAKPGVSAPIASATTKAQLDDLMPSLTLALSPDEMARLDAAGA
ncbi:MAG TPA: aldo/keto reductase [Sphingobium sp.]|uniref:aldo/keto reductase n=1 Tax=Sphingobium sp. TaxID=1912891 RepID=UPI002ED56D02